MAVIVLFVVAGLGAGRGSVEHFAAPAAPSIFSSGVATSLVFVSFAYSGWNAAAYLGGEIRKPERNLPLSILAGTSFVVVVYLALNAAFVYAVPAEQMKGVKEIGALAASRLFGEAVGSAFSMVIALLLLSTMSAMIMTGPRIYFAMARDGAFPPALARLDPRRKTPLRAILLQSTIAVAMAVTSTFETLLVYIGYLLAIFTSITVLGLVRLRRAQPGRPRPYRTWGYPVTPLLFVGVNLWIVVFSVRDNLAAFLVGLGTLALGLVPYEILRRRRRG
jgi:APA family basic amino acid/polyamine antiporter